MQNYLGYVRAKKWCTHAPKNLYHKHYFEAFDTAINSIEDRFDQEDCKMNSLLEQVLLKAAKHDEYEEGLKEVVQFYKENFYESLVRLQPLTFSINFQSAIKKDANITFSAVCAYLQKLSSGIKSFFSQAIPLGKLVLVTTATKTASDQSFSAMW